MNHPEGNQGVLHAPNDDEKTVAAMDAGARHWRIIGTRSARNA